MFIYTKIIVYLYSQNQKICKIKIILFNAVEYKWNLSRLGKH